MKMNRVFFIAVLVIAAGLFSCKKYPEGPSFSLASKKSRLANSWVLTKAVENGTDRTGDYQTAYKDLNWIIDKEGTYSLSYSPFGLGTYTETGSWALDGDKEKITFDPSSNNNGSSTNNILRLKEKELWLLDEDFNGKILEIHLSPK